METVYKNSKFIIGFLVLVFIFQMAFGEKNSQKFVLVVIGTMVILNAQNFIDFMSSTFSADELEVKTDSEK